MTAREGMSRRTTDEWEGRIGEQVRRLRERAGLTQGDLAKRSNVSIGAVQNLEYGAGSRLATLVQVTRALGRSSWLEDLAPPVPTSPMKLLEERQASTPPVPSSEGPRSLQRSRQARAASVPSIDPELGRALAQSSPAEAIESSQRGINTAGWGGAVSGIVREGEHDDVPSG